MDFLVEFSEQGARIIKDPTLIESKKNNSNVLLNPDISHLAGISPSFWIKEGDKVGHIGAEKSKEAVFGGAVYSPSFSTPLSAPEGVISKIDLIQSKMNDIDAKHQEISTHLKTRIEQQNEFALKFTMEIEEKLEDMQFLYEKKITKIQITYFVIVLIMVLLRFL